MYPDAVATGAVGRGGFDMDIAVAMLLIFVVCLVVVRYLKVRILKLGKRSYF